MEKNKGLVGLVILLSVLVLGLVGYIFYTKVNDSNIGIDNDNNVEQQANVFGHVLSSQVGNFIVDKNGSVYYEPSSNLNIAGNIVALKFLESAKNVLGVYDTYSVDNYDINPSTEIDSFKGYKLNLSNIKTANQIYFGNGSSGISIIFISNDGKVSEYVFDFESINNDGYTNVLAYNEIKNYDNIVSAVPTSGFSGKYAILIDSDGNQYKYYGASNQ